MRQLKKDTKAKFSDLLNQRDRITCLMQELQRKKEKEKERCEFQAKQEFEDEARRETKTRTSAVEREIRSRTEKYGEKT